MENKGYTQFGAEWRKEVMKLKKSDIVDLFKTQCIMVQDLEDQLKNKQ